MPPNDGPEQESPYQGRKLDPPITVKGLVDKAAEDKDDLMFLKGEVIELIEDLGDKYLGKCQGVLGYVYKSEIEDPDGMGSGRRHSRKASKRRSRIEEDDEREPNAASPNDDGFDENGLKNAHKLRTHESLSKRKSKRENSFKDDGEEKSEKPEKSEKSRKRGDSVSKKKHRDEDEEGDDEAAEGKRGKRRESMSKSKKTRPKDDEDDDKDGDNEVKKEKKKKNIKIRERHSKIEKDEYLDSPSSDQPPANQETDESLPQTPITPRSYPVPSSPTSPIAMTASTTASSLEDAKANISYVNSTNHSAAINGDSTPQDANNNANNDPAPNSNNNNNALNTEGTPTPTTTNNADAQPTTAPSASTILVRYPLNDENTDEFGFDKTQAVLTSTHSLKEIWGLETYLRREGKWLSMVKSIVEWKSFLKKNYATVKERCYKGIPESVRGKAWEFLVDSDAYKQGREFQSFFKQERPEIIEVIERDIDRCFPNHIRFREVDGIGQQELSLFLKSYAFYNPEIGYCQGMGMVAGMLMMQMPTDVAFWVMVSLLDQEKYLKNFYDKKLSQLTFSVGVFWSIVEKMYPKVHAHLKAQFVEPLMFATQWYMTVFTTILPWASVLQVWDVFLLIGKAYLHKVSLAIIDIHQEKIMSCNDLQELLEYLLHLPQETLIPEVLFKAVEKLKISTSEIEKIHENYNKK